MGGSLIFRGGQRGASFFSVPKGEPEFLLKFEMMAVTFPAHWSGIMMR